jgi:MoaA/NifB/PqqE/SkfB family radical SAM enzyme
MNGMGIQPKELLAALLSPTQSLPGRFRGAVRGGHWWTRIPQLLNLAKYKLTTMHTTLQKDSVLDYDPFYLHITPAETHPLATKSPTPSRIEASMACMLGQRIGLESFRFLLDQLPSVLAIDFSGEHNDPLENPELLDMINYAYRFNGAESTIYTDGLQLEQWSDALVKSSLHVLVINMVGHRPSSYSLMSGQPLAQFVTILNNVKTLLERKKFYHSNLSVELRMTIDVHNFQEIPAMIQFAQELGVDGIHFDNYLAPNSPGKSEGKSDRSLYSHHMQIVRYLQEIEQLYAGNTQLTIHMPKLLTTDMSTHRHCKDAFSTVSVDAELNVSACSRHLLLYGPLGKIWDEDFFNNPMYQWLRGIFTKHTDPKDAPSIPAACQGCPRNLPGLDSAKGPVSTPLSK